MRFTNIIVGHSVLAVASATALPTQRDHPIPISQTLNGSYFGTHNAAYEVDYFLGMPYAQPPVGDLRLRSSQSLNSSWASLRNATEYGYGCVGFGEDTEVASKNYISEDCLTVNVIRPSGVEEGVRLPVLVWIYGGGFVQGNSLDQRYNLTFIVQQSAKIGKPIIAVSLNYRLAAYGFLWSQDIMNQKITNLGLRDQRLALHWINENIEGFGGDPDKVTIWGESAGGMSVGCHVLAYNGRDDGLFRAAIAESGSPVGTGLANALQTEAEQYYKNLTQLVGCADEADKIQCLRKVPADVLYNAQSSQGTALMSSPTGHLIFAPIVDGDIVTRSRLEQLRDGSFVKVPYLIGDNSDEGSAFAALGTNTDQQIQEPLQGLGMNDSDIATVMKLYPNNPATLVLADHPGQFNSTIGLQWKRVATIVGDIMMIVPRKLAIATMAKFGIPIWTYRFNTIPNGVPDYYGVTHFMEMAFAMFNLEGAGYTGESVPYLAGNPFSGEPQTWPQLSDLMSKMWISFVNDLDPNSYSYSGSQWLQYNASSHNQIVFDAARGTHMEDVYALRANSTKFLIDYMWDRADEI